MSSQRAITLQHDLEKVGVPALRALAYAPGLFFCYPWRPLLNYLIGDSYDVAYQHFGRDHKTPVNLWLHLCCLWMQISGNFGILHEIDSFLFPKEQ